MSGIHTNLKGITSVTEQAISEFKESQERNKIYLSGYMELIELLETPGNISKQDLSTIINKTLAKSITV